MLENHDILNFYPSIVTLFLLSHQCYIPTLQAVRSQAVPTTQIPTEEKFKIYGKKQPKPPKSVVVAASKKMRRM
jgi:hypothetical protein